MTELSTEEKIKVAARKVFHEKGFAATRTRDIAAEAGINLALLSYYFKNKQWLFEVVMGETISLFIEGIRRIVNQSETSFDEKIELLVSDYIDMFLKEPAMLNFIFNEVINNNADLLTRRIGVDSMIQSSVLFVQYEERMRGTNFEGIAFVQFMVNVMGMIVVPFMAKPVVQGFLAAPKDEQFQQMMLERKRLIPIWIKAMIVAER